MAGYNDMTMRTYHVIKWYKGEALVANLIWRLEDDVRE